MILQKSTLTAIAFFAIGALTVFVLTNSTSGPATTDTTSQATKAPTQELSDDVTVEKIKAAEFYSDFTENPDKYVLVDVRTAPHRAIEYPENSLFLPLHRLLLGDLPRDKTIVVYCQGESSESVAYHALKNSGYENVYIIENASTGWKDAGLPLASGERWQINLAEEVLTDIETLQVD